MNSNVHGHTLLGQSSAVKHIKFGSWSMMPQIIFTMTLKRSTKNISSDLNLDVPLTSENTIVENVFSCVGNWKRIV